MSTLLIIVKIILCCFFTAIVFWLWYATNKWDPTLGTYEDFKEGRTIMNMSNFFVTVMYIVIVYIFFR